MNIELHTSAGLANRLRAIDSAVVLADFLKAKLCVYWKKDNCLAADYPELFQKTNVFEVKPHPPSRRINALFRSVQRYLNRTLEYTSRDISPFPKQFSSPFGQRIASSLPEEVFSGKKTSIRIETDQAFCYPENYSYLTPIPQIKKQIDTITAKFPDRCIGVHIRRGDHSSAIESSPSENFLNEIETLLSAEPHTKFFLATDDAKLKSRIFSTFPDSIIAQHTPPRRTDLEGMQSALVDLWCLSRCQEIWGSQGSSFSELAYHLFSPKLFIISKTGRNLVASKDRQSAKGKENVEST